MRETHVANRKIACRAASGAAAGVRADEVDGNMFGLIRAQSGERATEGHARRVEEKNEVPLRGNRIRVPMRRNFFGARRGSGVGRAQRPALTGATPQMFRVLRRAYRVSTTTDPYFGYVQILVYVFWAAIA